MTTAQDQQSRELLPCPFCGSPNVTLEHIQSTAYEALCEFCGASGPCDSEQWRAEKGWNARALPARGVDPMLDTPAGMEPVATVLSSRPGNDTSTIDEAIPAGSKLYTAARALPAAEPVSGQCRFVGEAAWLGCAAEHVRSVLATPQDWEGNEVRYLYAAAPWPPAAPATTEPQAPTTGAGSATAGAAPAYRLLQPGVDTIQATDEVLADDVVTWKAVGRGIFAGMTYIGAMLPVRRALKTGP